MIIFFWFFCIVLERVYSTFCFVIRIFSSLFIFHHVIKHCFWNILYGIYVFLKTSLCSQVGIDPLIFSQLSDFWWLVIGDWWLVIGDWWLVIHTKKGFYLFFGDWWFTWWFTWWLVIHLVIHLFWFFSFTNLVRYLNKLRESKNSQIFQRGFIYLNLKIIIFYINFLKKFLTL